MYKIYCDETWKDSDSKDVNAPYYLFHGVLIKDEDEDRVLESIAQFRKERGLADYEIKWEKAQKEYKEYLKSGRPNRYTEYLREIFFNFLKQKVISFGVMYLEKEEFDRVQTSFTTERNCHKHEFLFMLYYQFITHCFIRTQIKNSPVEIFIDGRCIETEDGQYDLDVFRRILNRKQALMMQWKTQLELDDEWLDKYRDAVRFVGLQESKTNEFIQLADLVAGCFRYIRENNLPSPKNRDQGTLFDQAPQIVINNGRDYLADFFYLNLINIDGYRDLVLCEASYHYRFNIFPFHFKKSLQLEST